MNRKIKCVCYCRVSTSSKEQLNSFENQKDFFEKYIAEHKELTLYKSKENPTGIYADRGISGTLLHREAFEEMLEAAGLIIERVDYKDVPKKDSDGRECFITYRDYTYRFSKEEPKFSLILVKNTSRFSRNILIADVLRKLSAIGVYVKFLDIDTQQALAETIPAALTQAIEEMTSELKSLEDTYSKLTKKPAQQIKECETLLEICYTGISEMENPHTTYTEQELFEIVSHFVVYSEVQKVRGGMHGPPKVELVPILKTEALLHTKFGIDLDPQAPIPYSTMGFENDRENILTQLKTKVQEVEKVLETLKSVYFSSMD